MPWRDDLIDGRFRDAPFLTERHSFTGGRRLARHEYPLRDRPWVEDMGRSARGFRMEIFVLGEDYMAARDRLIEALEQKGAGTLRHPYLGTMRVEVASFRQSETTREGGKATFSVEFVESGEQREPRARLQTPSVVTDKADSARRQAEESFADSFDTSGQPEFVRAAAESTLGRAADAIGAAADAVPTVPDGAAAFRDRLSRLSNSVSDLVLKPLELAQGVTALIEDLGAIAERPDEALSMYEGMEDFGVDDKPITGDTPARKQQRANRDASNALMRDASAIAAARASSRMTWPSVNDATFTRDRIAKRLDDRADQAFDDRYRRLADLRVAVIRDITNRGADLARIGYHTPMQVQPALVLAHRIHGDAKRDQEIVDRNDVRHPGFVPAGDPLEVLLDADD